MNRAKQNSLTTQILGRSISRSRSPPINSNNLQQKIITEKTITNQNIKSHSTLTSRNRLNYVSPRIHSKKSSKYDVSKQQQYKNQSRENKHRKQKRIRSQLNNYISMEQNFQKIPDQKNPNSPHLINNKGFNLPKTCFPQIKSTRLKNQNIQERNLTSQNQKYYYNKTQQKSFLNDQQFQFKDVDLGVPYVQSRHLDSGFQDDFYSNIQKNGIISFNICNEDSNNSQTIKIPFVSSGKQIFTSILDIQQADLSQNNQVSIEQNIQQNMSYDTKKSTPCIFKGDKTQKSINSISSAELQQQNFTDQQQNSVSFEKDITTNSGGHQKPNLSRQKQKRSRKRTITIDKEKSQQNLFYQQKQLQKKMYSEINQNIKSDKSLNQQIAVKKIEINQKVPQYIFYSNQTSRNLNNQSNQSSSLIEVLKQKNKARQQKIKYWNSQLHEMQKSQYSLQTQHPSFNLKKVPFTKSYQQPKVWFSGQQIDKQSIRSLQAEFLQCLNSVNYKLPLQNAKKNQQNEKNRSNQTPKDQRSFQKIKDINQKYHDQGIKYQQQNQFKKSSFIKRSKLQKQPQRNFKKPIQNPLKQINLNKSSNINTLNDAKNRKSRVTPKQSSLSPSKYKIKQVFYNIQNNIGYRNSLDKDHNNYFLSNLNVKRTPIQTSFQSLHSNNLDYTINNKQNSAVDNKIYKHFHKQNSQLSQFNSSQNQGSFSMNQKYLSINQGSISLNQKSRQTNKRSKQKIFVTKKKLI